MQQQSADARQTEEWMGQLCNFLGVAQPTQVAALEILAKLQAPVMQRNEKCCCALLLAGSRRFHHSASGRNACNLTSLLRACDVPLNKVFPLLTVAVELTCNAESTRLFKEQLELLRANFMVTKAVFHKYDIAFGKLPVSNCGNQAQADMLFSLAWLLFALAKAALLHDPVDEACSMCLMVCCWEAVLFGVSPPASFESYDADPGLTYLCEGIDAQQLVAQRESYFALFLSQLLAEKLPECKVAFTSGAGPLGKRVYISGLLNCLVNLCAVVNKEYNYTYLSQEDFDARLFITNEVESFIVSTPHDQTVKRSGLNPAGYAQATVPWLMGVLLDRLEAPSTSFIALCHDVKFNLQPLLEAVTHFAVLCTTDGNLLEPIHVPMTIRLYYKLLEELVSKEKQPDMKANLSALLRNDIFTKSVFACSAEIVLFAYQLSTAGAPSQGSNRGAATATNARASGFHVPERVIRLLAVLQLHCFHFEKLLFEVIHLEALPPDLTLHLLSVDETIVEELAWEPQSPLFSLLGTANPPTVKNFIARMLEPAGVPPGAVTAAAAAAAARPAIPATPQKSQAGLQTFLSPANRPSNSVPFSPRVAPLPVLASGLPRSLALFLNKLSIIAHHRLHGLLERLRMPGVFHDTWQAFAYAVAHRHAQLMTRRHLDSVLMCCIYGVCRATSHTVHFVDIEREYANQPFGANKNQALHAVPLRDRQVGDLVAFYNDIFVTEMFPFLEELKVATSALPQAGSAQSQQPPSTPLKNGSQHRHGSCVSPPPHQRAQPPHTPDCRNLPPRTPPQPNEVLAQQQQVLGKQLMSPGGSAGGSISISTLPHGSPRFKNLCTSPVSLSTTCNLGQSPKCFELINRALNAGGSSGLIGGRAACGGPLSPRPSSAPLMQPSGDLPTTPYRRPQSAQQPPRGAVQPLLPSLFDGADAEEPARKKRRRSPSDSSSGSGDSDGGCGSNTSPPSSPSTAGPAEASAAPV
eukprot:TRINITY_DN29_c1_g1_i2.p1 TRINITY_DN29_c1_g1~~TRINITY_DN29_c1_g1_i2.p1  ORF type:complete len:977 (+),score=261.21 TRINITY_DN29_c1_g1_i2:171-3101(+)